MTIAEAIQKDIGNGIRRKEWPNDWRIEPTDGESCCILSSNNKSSPRWEPQKDDLAAYDWEPIKEI